MTNLVLHRDSTEQAIALPQPRHGAINIRTATPEDIPFIDQLQKKHSKMVGFFPRVWFEKNIEDGNVLIAEEDPGPWAVGAGAESDSPSRAGTGSGGGSNGDSDNHTTAERGRPTHPPAPSLKGGGVAASPASLTPTPLGYCVYKDKYLKREELGIVYQLNVVPGKQRGLIGASLVKAAFERCPYGVKLFCCWCAQDIEANYFWESIGFVPIAFRTGSRPRMRKDGTISKPERIHIFWQRRIRAEENQANTGETRTGETPVPLGPTPYWFPSETSGGAVRENRIVLPIPPGTHWSDAKPAVLPGLPGLPALDEPRPSGSGGLELALDADPLPHGRGSSGSKKRKRKRREKREKLNPRSIASGGLRFGPSPEELKREKPKPEKRVRKARKNDPKYVAAARELRDRYLEQVNAPAGDQLLQSAAHGKYDVSRQMESAPSRLEARNLLDAA